MLGKDENNEKDALQIQEEPTIPAKLIDAYSKGKLAIFVGAGVSRLMGCMGWDEMSNRLINEVCDPSIANQILSSNLSSKAKITIAFQIAEKSKEEEKKFWKIFKKAITPDKREKDVYETIEKLNTLFITTNCDGLLRKHFQSQYSTDCSPQSYDDYRDKTFVFCLHGDYGTGRKKDKKALVFTEDKYLEKYSSETKHVEFLRRIMNEKTVLFIGYGLSEFEILKVAFSSTPKDNCKHFLLEGFYQYQREYMNVLNSYYRCLGINLISYSKDKNGYKQLRNVIERWIGDLQKKTGYISNSIDSIRNSLGKVNDTNKAIVYHEIDRKDELGAAYFSAMLQELPKEGTCYKWIRILIEDKKIRADDIPGIRETKDGYLWKGWDVFDCILTCLKTREILDEDKEILEQFTRECMRHVLKDEKTSKNGAVIDQIGEIFFKLKIVPIEEDCIFIEKWNDYSVDGGYHIYVDQLEWIISLGDDKATKIIGLLYRKCEYYQSDRSYWFEKFSRIFAEKASQSILNDIIVLCTTRLIDESKESTFYSGYSDRFHMNTYAFESHMAKSISILLSRLCEEKRKAYFEEQLGKCKETSEYQLIINYAKECNINVTSYFHDNPLNTYHTFVDFYLWLKKMCDTNSLSDDDRSKLGKWIKEATFGYDEAEQEYWKEIIKNKTNAYKYYLLEMINYKNEYDQDLLGINEAGFANIKAPDEGIEEYYTIRDIPPEKYFESIDFSVMTDEDIYKIYKAEIKKKQVQNPMFFAREICEALFNHITNAQLEEFIIRCIENEKDLFALISLSLHNESTMRRMSKTLLKKLLNKWKTLIYNCDPNENGILNLIRDYVYFLQALKYSDMSKEEVLTQLLKVDATKLFMEEVKYDEQMDVIMNIINTSESQYYSLMFEYAALCKNNATLITRFTKWLNAVISRTQSKWFSLSCAYGIQNLLLVDMNRVNTVVLPYLRNYEKQSHICLSITCGLNSVVRDIVDYISEEGRIDGVLEIITPPSKESRYASQYINYVVAAYCYGILYRDAYVRFIKNIPNEEIGYVIWSIIFGIKGSDKDKKIKMFKEAIALLGKEKKAIACVELFNDISRLDNIDRDWWGLLANATTWSKVGTNIWILVEECLRRTKRKNKKIEIIIKWLINSLVVPYEITLKRILYSLVKLGLKKEGSDIAYFAVENNINPTFFGKCIQNPSNIIGIMDEDD